MANNKAVSKNTKTNNKKSTTKGTTKTVKKNPTKKTTTAKKTTTVKKSTTPKVSKNIKPIEEEVKVIKQEETKVKDISLEKVIEPTIPEKETSQERVEKEIIKEIESVKVAKLENAKYKTVKKDKTLLNIGVILALLGIIALLISLTANRLVDSEFLSDNTITLMLAISIVIEGFGAFIIINES